MSQRQSRAPNEMGRFAKDKLAAALATSFRFRACRFPARVMGAIAGWHRHGLSPLWSPQIPHCTPPPTPKSRAHSSASTRGRARINMAAGVVGLSFPLVAVFAFRTRDPLINYYKACPFALWRVLIFFCCSTAARRRQEDTLAYSPGTRLTHCAKHVCTRPGSGRHSRWP